MNRLQRAFYAGGFGVGMGLLASALWYVAWLGIAGAFIVSALVAHLVLKRYYRGS